MSGTDSATSSPMVIPSAIVGQPSTSSLHSSEEDITAATKFRLDHSPPSSFGPTSSPLHQHVVTTTTTPAVAHSGFSPLIEQDAAEQKAMISSSTSDVEVVSMGVGVTPRSPAEAAVSPHYEHTPTPPAGAKLQSTVFDVVSVEKTPAPPTTTNEGPSSGAADNTYYPIHINDRVSNKKGRHFPSNYARTTKYSILTFLPKTLFEQYRKLTNIYFLLIVVITLIPQISPITPVTSILPVLFVLAVGMIRELVEDLKRFKSDRAVNTQMFQYYATFGVANSLTDIESKDVKVGDIVRLNSNDRVPADCIALKTNSPDGLCYLETSQLDGETNLKSYNAIPFTAEMTIEQILSLKGTVVCEKPNAQLRKFEAYIKMDDGTRLSVSEKQLLLQGASLKNTEYALGVVVYTGQHTKLAKNQRNPPSKVSHTEKVMNRFVLGVLATKIVLCIVLAIHAAVSERNGTDHWYLWGSGTHSAESALKGLKMFFAYFALLSYIIPMSLVVTLEVVKFVQAAYMEWDEQMMYETEDHGIVTQAGAIAKTSSLNDELSMVKYIFSDKTGTLTQNKMEFAECSINGTIYNDPMHGQVLKTLQRERGKGEASTERESLEEFLLCLALCHTVVPEVREGGEIEFQAQSPDEAALCLAAKANGYTFCDRKQKTLVVRMPEGDVSFSVLADIEFSSDRRRMSVIIRDGNGRVTLYTKGADNVMLPLITQRQNELRRLTADQINDFSRTGLRTLVLARKVLADDVFAQWREQYDVATTSIGNREEAVKTLFGEIENDMDMLGCTAVEDKLQVGVPETIHMMLRAGIQVWMITGDKQETAINIGRSCKLVSSNAKLLLCSASDITQVTKTTDTINRLIVDSGCSDDCALVINGCATDIVIHHAPKLFMELVSHVRSVVCCQVTPLQKAQIVGCVKKHTREVCLSIGDGANDVSMIQTADIGVGLFGKEGTQAARASDYAIQQFRHVARLVLIHGRYSMVRNSLVIKWSFYKNVAFFITQFLFAFWNRSSSQTIYDDYIITFYNIVITVFPPFLIGMFEKDAPDDLIMSHPEVNRKMAQCRMFKIRDLFTWLGIGFYHSLLFYFVAFGVMYPEGGIISPDGDTSHFWIMSTYMTVYAVIAVHTTLLIKCKNWTVWNFAGFFLGLLSFAIIWIIEAFVPNAGYLYWTLPIVFAQPLFWITCLLVVVLAFFPLLVMEYVQRNWWPSMAQILVEQSKPASPKNLSIDLEAFPPAASGAADTSPAEDN